MYILYKLHYTIGIHLTYLLIIIYITILLIYIIYINTMQDYIIYINTMQDYITTYLTVLGNILYIYIYHL